MHIINSGLIFDVKRYAINDGPGIRVTIFFKGCPLSCKWCHNPESISPHIQKMYSADKCIRCKACVEACPENACTITADTIITDMDVCTGCGICANICPTKATEMSGRIVTVEEVASMVEKERIFFDQSGGGVTFSGGEPLRQPEFLLALLERCGEQALHRTVDTCGFATTETLLKIAKHTDHFLYDIKLMDSKRHKIWTGVGNEKILENLKILAATDASLTLRIPLIQGVNDDDENIEKTAAFVSELAGEKKLVNLLPYHNIAAHKYQKLGQTYDSVDLAETNSEQQEQIIAKFAGFDVKAVVGG